ncbi:MAG TPA: mechanosensitive ion channel family protein [Polyangiaceae bacterium]|nr:mechanosensitive ion channel family protein [Polyangiaceae bacterium]
MNTYFAARTAAVGIVLALGVSAPSAHAQAKKHAPSAAASKHPPAAAPAEAAAAAAVPAATVPAATAPAAVEAEPGAPPPAAVSTAGASGVDSVEAVLAGVTHTGGRIAELRKGVSQASGDRRELLLPELTEVRTQYRRELTQAAALLTGANPVPGTPEELTAARTQVGTALTAEGALIRGDLERELEQFTSLISKVDSAPADQRAKLEQSRNGSAAQAPLLLGELDSNLDARGLLGLDVSAERKKLETTLISGSKLVGAALHGISASLDQLAQSAGAKPKPEDEAKRTAIEDFRSLVVDLQRKNLALMDKYGLDTTQHRQDLISTTGQVTQDILDAKVATGLAKKMKDDAIDWISDHASAFIFNAISFTLIVLLFLGLARIGRSLARRTIGRSSHMSNLASDFFITLTGRIILGIGLVIAAAQIGIQVAPVLAGLGIVGFVLGFALQETLSNFAAGMMILMYRPFDVGDMIEAAGVIGTVKAMTLVSTSVVTDDNQMLVVPNNKIWGGVIRNITNQRTRRVDLTFAAGYGDALHAQKVLEGILAENPLVLKDPAPVVRLHELTDSLVKFVVRPWVKTADYWTVYWGVTQEVKQRFEAEGLSTPYPRRNVHIFQEHAAERAVGRTSDVVPADSQTIKVG